MKKETFEDYLQAHCFEENPQVLDDDMPDFFDDWLSNRDVSEMIIHADVWMNTTKSKLAQEIRELF